MSEGGETPRVEILDDNDEMASPRTSTRLQELKQSKRTELIRYILSLESELSRERDFNQKLYQDNITLSRKCKEHFDNVQKLLRTEFRQPEGKRPTYGVVHGTGQVFSVQDGKVKLEEALPKELQ